VHTCLKYNPNKGITEMQRTISGKKDEQKVTFKPAGAKTSRSLMGLYSIPYMRWMPSVIDNFKHLLGPACVTRYLSLKGADILTISSTCKTQSHVDNSSKQKGMTEKECFNLACTNRQVKRKKYTNIIQ
jgi:hypothetical protein